MKTKLFAFQQDTIIGYDQRINHIEVDFDDEKMKLKLQQFFVIWLLENTDPDKVTVDSIEELARYANQLHTSGNGYHMAKDKDRLYMADFIQQEMENLNVFPPQCDPEKAKSYKAYLTKVFPRFLTLKNLNLELIMWKIDTGFKQYFELAFELAFGSGYVNVAVVEKALSFFLKTADNQYFYEILNGEGFFYPKMLMIPETVELKYNINPPLLLGNEEKKKEYKKILGTWLLAKLEERIYQYRLDKHNLPASYLFVKQTAEALFHNLKTAIEMETMLPEKTIISNFNPRIFKDALAFELFEKQNAPEIKPTDLSFLYRKMAEKENPPLILVRDTEFRDWYAKMYDPKIVQNFTKTFDRAYSKERNEAYEHSRSEVFKP